MRAIYDSSSKNAKIADWVTEKGILIAEQGIIFRDQGTFTANQGNSSRERRSAKSPLPG
jgi:hypothetical protein